MNKPRLFTNNISFQVEKSPQARLERLQNDLAGIYSQMSTEQKPNTLKNILVIDADESRQQTLKFYLENHGVTVKATGNGFDALNHIHNSPFHLILTSISVPVISGNLIAMYVKNHMPNLPIIAMSQSVWMAEDYFDSVLKKPLNLPALLKEVLFQISKNTGANQAL